MLPCIRSKESSSPHSLPVYSFPHYQGCHFEIMVSVLIFVLNSLVLVSKSMVFVPTPWFWHDNLKLTG